MVSTMGPMASTTCNEDRVEMGDSSMAEEVVAD